MRTHRSAKTTKPGGRYVTDRRGKRTGVVLALKRYSRLLEDLHNPAPSHQTMIVAGQLYEHMTPSPQQGSSSWAVGCGS